MCMLFNTPLLLNACYQVHVPRKACANTELLNSTQNEHKNESFYANENESRL